MLMSDSGISSSILSSDNPFAATRLIEQLTQQLENAFQSNIIKISITDWQFLGKGLYSAVTPASEVIVFEVWLGYAVR